MSCASPWWSGFAQDYGQRRHSYYSDIVSDVSNNEREGLQTTFQATSTIMKDTDPEDEQTKGLSVGVLVVLEDDVSVAGSSANIQNLAIVLKETIAMEQLSDISTGFAYLFGLLYALNLSYPKDLKYTFSAIQNVFMKRGINFRNKLFAV
ncbi:hypothetical protein NFI96_002433 [Prochilodus magdalenae]|nr:hypothetical protein NFI96_002433 [Prochilodus magdalenae]